MSSYQQLPVAFERGSGVWLTDQNGQQYLDALSGIGVCVLGHAHPEIEKAIADQAGKLLHTSNLYHIPLQEALAERLTSLAGMEKVFFANSGAEANEVAIKIARLFGHQQGIDHPVVITATGSFHGRTMATLSATGNSKVQQGFEPLVEKFVHVPYNDMEVLSRLTDANIVAVMLEPIQGEGGVVIPDEGYLKTVRDICDQNNWLLILDEIQTGMCRTGEWFAFQHEKITPDVMTLAKALGNGVPIGACLAKGTAADLIKPGSHGSTFGGNPLASRAALAVIDVLSKQKLHMKAAKLGAEMLARFKSELSEIEGVVSVRGKGLMLAIELDRECAQLVKMALQEYLLINVASENVIRILPPLIIDDDTAQQVVEKVVRIVKAFLKEE
ncbi:MAG: aspartate aminotransferase family protein [Gammaproteobacteria bacterium]|nr:MAG: aspartate aminotransferase family protein [Gammaproteobacteria bacterium]